MFHHLIGTIYEDLKIIWTENNGVPSTRVSPWAKFQTAKGGIKLYVSPDEATMIPQRIKLSPAKVSDWRGADNFICVFK